MTTNRTLLIRLTSWAPIFAAVLGVTFFGAHEAMDEATSNWAIGTDEQLFDIRPHIEEGTPTAVLAEHQGNCWRQDDTPKADLPGAAIVQWVGGDTEYTEARAIVSSAFEEALSKAGYGKYDDARINVVALCI